MEEPRDKLIDETILRRALRLEADEPTPRFDAAAIAALARPRVVPAVVLGGIACAAAIGVVASALGSAASAFGPDVVSGAIAFVLDGVDTLASLLYPILQAATDPVVPLSLIAATGVAIYHEMRTRREHAHVHAA